MPTIFIFQERDTFTFDGFGNNQRGRTIWLRGLRVCLVDFIIIVTIDDDGIPAKGFGTRCIGSGIPT